MSQFGPSTVAHQRIPHLWHVTTSGKPGDKETNPRKSGEYLRNLSFGENFNQQNVTTKYLSDYVGLLWNNIAMNTQSPTLSKKPHESLYHLLSFTPKKPATEWIPSSITNFPPKSKAERLHEVIVGFQSFEVGIEFLEQHLMGFPCMFSGEVQPQQSTQ